VEKLSHVTDNIQSKAEQILALVSGLDLGEAVKSEGGKGTGALPFYTVHTANKFILNFPTIKCCPYVRSVLALNLHL
jgi:hypothetical protein